MRVTGPAAQFGRGVMQDVSAKLMGRFADCLAEEMAGAAPPPPAAEEAGGAVQAAASPEPTPSTPAPEGARVVGPLNPAAHPPPGPAGESAEAAAAAASGAAETAASGAAAPPPVAPRRTEEVLDLGEASREAVLKRVAPVAATMVGLIVLLGIRRWRR
jgi:uncharacterized protein